MDMNMNQGGSGDSKARTVGIVIILVAVLVVWVLFYTSPRPQQPAPANNPTSTAASVNPQIQVTSGTPITGNPDDWIMGQTKIAFPPIAQRAVITPKAFLSLTEQQFPSIFRQAIVGYSYNSAVESKLSYRDGSTGYLVSYSVPGDFVSFLNQVFLLFAQHNVTALSQITSSDLAVGEYEDGNIQMRITAHIATSTSDVTLQTVTIKIK